MTALWPEPKGPSGQSVTLTPRIMGLSQLGLVGAWADVATHHGKVFHNMRSTWQAIAFFHRQKKSVQGW